MNYLIVPRRRLGIAVDSKELCRTQPIQGDIQIAEVQSDALGRVSVSAWIFVSSSHMPDPLPRLLDVRITGMSTNGMNITGIEQIGDAFYSQSWWCRGV
jgi:hypothetical protein